MVIGMAIVPRFRLTTYFAITALLVMSAVTIAVSRVGSRLAEENLVRLTQENTARVATHIQSMMWDRVDGDATGAPGEHENGHDSAGEAGAHATNDKDMPMASGVSMEAIPDGRELLNALAGPSGLSSHVVELVAGLDIVQLNVIDLGGVVVWSSVGPDRALGPDQGDLFKRAAAGSLASTFLKWEGVRGADRQERSINAVSTFAPMYDPAAGEQIGVIAIVRDVDSDYSTQVDDTNAKIPRITLTFMAVMFTAFSGFMVAADVMIARGRRRERTLAEVRLAEQKTAEQAMATKADELARSNADLEQFAYVASHDLQEPLRMVASYTQLLGKRFEGKLGDEADGFIGFAVDGARRMQTLINDLLAYSRVGTDVKEMSPTDCEYLLDGVLADLQGSLQETGATVTRDPMPTVVADASQLGRLFINLIGNGLKYRGEAAPEIHVGYERREDEWLFTVQDNGIGIDPGYAERIFVIFQRLHTRDEYPGTGIGLAICKRIVERHGGRIWVESQVGAGATFYFTLSTNHNGVEFT